MEAGPIIAMRHYESLLEFFVPFVASCLKDKGAPSTKRNRDEHSIASIPSIHQPRRRLLESRPEDGLSRSFALPNGSITAA